MIKWNRLLIVAMNRRGCACSHVAGEELPRRRTLKVAVLGSPNAGKSTLINHLVGRPVFGVSEKVHTTRKKARAAFVRGDTQVVFVDTPGLVSKSEMKRHNLEQSFESDTERAVKEANLIGVVQDVGNPWTKDKLDAKVIRILKIVPEKPSFIILNKVDLLKGKSKLLELVKILTNESIITTENREVQRGWPAFSEVFMVSALTGDGMNSVKEYLLSQARDGPWLLEGDVACDSPHHQVVLELVKARLLDALPDEIPYNVKCEMEYFHRNELGEVICVVLMRCPVLRHQKMLLSRRGKTVRKIAELAEKDARNALQSHVRLRLVVNVMEPKDKDKYEMRGRR